MTDIDIRKLFDTTLRKAIIKELAPKQNGTFLLACKRVYLDNQDGSFSDYLIAARIYLNYILRYPDEALPTDNIQLPVQ